MLLDDRDLVLLTEVNTTGEADVLISLLDSCGISAQKKYSGFSAVSKVYCGRSNLGVKLYVHKNDYETAKEILEAPFDENEIFGGEEC